MNELREKPKQCLTVLVTRLTLGLTKLGGDRVMYTRESHRFPNKHVNQGQPFYFQTKMDLKEHRSDVESTSG